MQHDVLIEVSPIQIGLTAIPVLGMAVISWYLDLGLESSILVGVVRSFVQLTILSYILNPIFAWGESLFWVVILYVFFMVILASFESANRSTYYFDGMFWYVVAILFVNVVWVSIFAFAIILQPTPMWDPQYVIPIVGMLLGNCINGISLSLNAMTTSLVESSREIELLLSFGATSYEATFRLLKEAARTGTMPQLNGMAIIGLISIPGMMTGQILGGSTVQDAARYQILIIYWIAACSFGTIFSQLFFVLRICFDHQMVLKTDRLKKRDVKPNAIDIVKSLCQVVASTFSGKSAWSHKRRLSSFSLPAISDESTLLVPKGQISVLISSPDNNNDRQDQVSLVVSNLCYSFANNYVDRNEDLLPESTHPGRRILFQDLSFKLTSGGSAIIQGPSGIGKSTLLRILARLVSHQYGTIDLIGETKNRDMAIWRRKILYVPQTKVDIPGTPLDLVRKISSFSVQRHFASGVPIHRELKDYMVQIVTSWGISNSLLDADWKTLSGGESQKILLAIALASRPQVILLDESTSAMDPTSKMQVERTVQDLCAKFGMCAIWVTHDEVQSERIHKIGRKDIHSMTNDG